MPRVDKQLTQFNDAVHHPRAVKWHLRELVAVLYWTGVMERVIQNVIHRQTQCRRDQATLNR